MRADVLVIGAGVAGAAAALEAAAAGARVVLTEEGGAASPAAQGGIAAAVLPGDGPELHAADTLAAAAGLGDPEAVRILTREAPGAIAWLQEAGVVFDGGPEGCRPALEAAHSQPRVLHASGDRSGAAIMAAIAGATARAGIERLAGARLVSLLGDGSGVVGARLALGSTVIDVHARATVLATGGYAGLWRRSTTPNRGGAAGLMAAADAGAELADLEFVQFHPTAWAGPGRIFLITEALRGAGAAVTDGRGRRFLFDADPRGELAPRATVARAIAALLRSTGDPHVLLDASAVGPARLREEFPGFLANCRHAGLDPLLDAVPIAPAAHYSMGGIVTDLCGRTAARGLLAAGECARVGVHGANRLASNSLLEGIVFGRRAGATAAGAPAPKALAGRPLRIRPAGPAPGAGEALEAGAGTLRSRTEMAAALDRLPGSASAPVVLAAAILGAAIARAETRGAHVRLDHPAAGREWGGKEIIFRSAPGRLRAAIRGRHHPDQMVRMDSARTA